MIDLFEQELDESKNRLPYNGEVYYYGALFNSVVASEYFEKLLSSIDWKYDKAVMYGKQIVTKRQVAWYADKTYNYTYSGVTRKALIWTNTLLELKKSVEQKTGASYNSCLLNLYHDGNEGMSWHNDDETALKKEGSIASLSLGAQRKFMFKHNKTHEKVEFLLLNGDLIEMKGQTQSYWKHCVPKTTKVKWSRINLTFRQIDA